VTLKVVQFTDMHFFGDAKGRLIGVDTCYTFKELVKQCRLERGTPDFYLLTGDLSQDKSKRSYRRLSQLMRRLGVCAYYIPGNHDFREIMTTTVESGNSHMQLKFSVAVGKWQVILLDSLVEDYDHGHINQTQLEQLDSVLGKEPKHHALICVHHHVLPTGSAWLDRIGIDNAADLLDVIDRHKNVRAVLSGHVHQELDEERNGVRYMTTPSTCVQFLPRAENLVIDRVPPGYRWLELNDNGSINSKVVRLPFLPPGLDLTATNY